MTKQATAIVLLNSLMTTRNWYKGTDLTKQEAHDLKRHKISAAKAEEVLNKLGWFQKEPPVWEKIDKSV